MIKYVYVLETKKRFVFNIYEYISNRFALLEPAIL